jgi:Uri superfamily endonuclease
MDNGIYCLVFKNAACKVRVGALGEVAFKPGWHVYTGSALGSGGLKRLIRHIGLSSTHDKRPKWHVDFLLTSPDFSLAYAVYAATGKRLECRLAGSLSGSGVRGFGCSDCSCRSHLFFYSRNPVSQIARKFQALDLVPVIKTIIIPQRGL